MSGPNWEAVAASPAVNWEEPESADGFASAVKSDISGVFLNPAEFGELRTIQYDGETYENIPVVLNGNIQQNRFRARRDPAGQPTQDHMQGIYLTSCILHCALSDLGGNRPEKGSRLRISEGDGFFHEYYVASSNIEMGMLRVELEGMDE